MKLLRTGILLATTVFAPAGAVATVADMVANIANVLRQAIDSPQPPVAALDVHIDQLWIEPMTSPIARGRTQFRRSRDRAAMAEPTPLSKAANPRTCMESWRENKDGCIMTSQRDAEVTSSTPLVGVTTSVDGGSIIQGDVLTISWQTSNAPAGSAVALMPQKALTGHIFDPIATALPTNGRYTWQIPIFVVQPIPCARDITGGCVGSMNPTTYKIVARLYTPVDADLTEFGPGKTYPTWIAWTESSEFTMLAAAAEPGK
jgi:hypothetical protein